jgi:hypothetical protein
LHLPGGDPVLETADGGCDHLVVAGIHHVQDGPGQPAAAFKAVEEPGQGAGHFEIADGVVSRVRAEGLQGPAVDVS